MNPPDWNDGDLERVSLDESEPQDVGAEPYRPSGTDSLAGAQPPYGGTAPDPTPISCLHLEEDRVCRWCGEIL